MIPKARTTPENLHRFGVAGKILKVLHADDDESNFLINCLERFSIKRLSPADRGLFAGSAITMPPSCRSIRSSRPIPWRSSPPSRNWCRSIPLYSEEIKLFLNRSSMDDPGRLADFAANLTTADGQELQQILETFDVRKRIDMVLVLLKKELEVSRLQTQDHQADRGEDLRRSSASSSCASSSRRSRRNWAWRRRGRTPRLEKFEERLQEAQAQRRGAEGGRRGDGEALACSSRIRRSTRSRRNYLDWLTILPWGMFSKDSLRSRHRARRILDRDHYGLKDVKERILEFIAVGKMKGDISGSILCFVGPPGVGKTSIGHSIADALGRALLPLLPRAACATRPRSRGTAAPTSAPCPASSSRR